jgi:hypothetical protein
MEQVHNMTDTFQITAHEQGRAGRPLSPAARRSRLRMSYIQSIGVENLTPEITEAILTAVELTVMAAEVRRKVAKAGAPTPDDLLSLVRIENAAARAVARLPVTTINTRADTAS